jgi:hypothetical protein
MMYSADDIINKSLYAEKEVTIYSLPDKNSEIKFTVQKTQLVGMVYSWIIDDGGQLWWLIWDGKTITGYVYHQQNTFSVLALQQQGVLTTLEKIEEAKNKQMTVGERITEYLTDTFNPASGVIKYGLPAFMIIYLGMILKKQNKKQ